MFSNMISSEPRLVFVKVSYLLKDTLKVDFTSFFQVFFEKLGTTEISL